MLRKVHRRRVERGEKKHKSWTVRFPPSTSDFEEKCQHWISHRSRLCDGCRRASNCRWHCVFLLAACTCAKVNSPTSLKNVFLSPVPFCSLLQRTANGTFPKKYLIFWSSAEQSSRDVGKENILICLYFVHWLRLRWSLSGQKWL